MSSAHNGSSVIRHFERVDGCDWNI